MDYFIVRLTIFCVINNLREVNIRKRSKNVFYIYPNDGKLKPTLFFRSMGGFVHGHNGWVYLLHNIHQTVPRVEKGVGREDSFFLFLLHSSITAETTTTPTSSFYINSDDYLFGQSGQLSVGPYSSAGPVKTQPPRDVVEEAIPKWR